MKITMIAAVDEEWGLGLNGKLAWKCPEDLAYFKQRTMDQVLIMGRVTALSVGNRLPGRTILTVSSDNFSTVASAVEKARELGFAECFLAGGRRIYEDGLSIAHTAEVTRIPGHHGCDVAFPDLSKSAWSITASRALTPGIVVETWCPEK